MLHIGKVKGNFFGLLPRSRSNEIIRSIAQTIASNIQDASLRSEITDLVSRDSSDLFASFRCLYSEMGIADAWRVRQVLALYTKNADRADAKSLQRKLIEDLSETEASCALINKAFATPESFKKHFEGYEHLLFMSRRKIAQMLGNCPVLEDLEIEFGPGASNTVKGKTTARWKLNAKPVISREALANLTDLWATLPSYAYDHRGQVRLAAGVFTGAAKDALNLRGILIEAALQTAVQKAYGKEIRKALRKVGIDLNSQDHNKRAAQYASRYWHLDNTDATVDLRRASSTIASLLVSDQLPLPWVEALSGWRTGCAWVTYKDKTVLHQLEMFSSMGNGYTFELESLLFYALTWALCVDQGVDPSRILVFGDDIVCPASIVEPLRQFFGKVGFEINEKKSYSNGPFRESCGGDYLYGRNIRPFYVKERLSTARLVAFHNYLVRLEQEYFTEVGHDLTDRSYDFVRLIKQDIMDVKRVLLNELPLATPRGPDGFGDGHLIDPIIWDYMASRAKAKEAKEKQLQIASFRTFTKQPVRSKKKLPIGDSLYPSYSIYLKKDSQFYTVNLKSKNALRTLARQALKGVKAETNDPFVVRDRKAFKSKLTSVNVISPPPIAEWELIPYSFDFPAMESLRKENEIWGAILCYANDELTRERMVALLYSVPGSAEVEHRLAYAKYVLDQAINHGCDFKMFDAWTSFRSSKDSDYI